MSWLMRAYVSALSETRSGAETGEDLAHMNDPSDANDLEETVVVGGLGKGFILLHAPWIGACTPWEDIKNDDTLYGREI